MAQSSESSLEEASLPSTVERLHEGSGVLSHHAQSDYWS